MSAPVPLPERPRHPETLAEDERSGERLVRWLRVPTDLAYLDGHFEGFPVVPGVVQLRWALDAAGELLGGAPCVREIEALKFKDLLRPGQRFALRVEVADGGKRLRFRLGDEHDDQLYSSGRCTLVPGGAER